jgi:methylenetetrahydrofolate reductase (NADPH)
MKSGSNLERVLTEGHFAVTSEIGPPKGGSADFVRKTAEHIKGCCDAMNVTDNQTAIVRMSSLAACAILRQMGIDAVMQMVTRDRNRLAMQSDILGAVALDIRNLLCLSGDHQKFGNHPTAKNVHDIDSIQLAQMAMTMRDEGLFLSGDKISGDVPLFVGCAANPFADPFEFRVLRLAKKINAGADFIQTQAVFDIPRFAKWMEMVCERELHRQAYILAGIIPMKSAGMARYMKKYVAGLMIPDDLVTRMEQASDAKQEGVDIACELIEQIRDIPGVRGIHIMAVAWEEIVPEIVEQVGLLPRPIV